MADDVADDVAVRFAAHFAAHFAGNIVVAANFAGRSEIVPHVISFLAACCPLCANGIGFQEETEETRFCRLELES